MKSHWQEGRILILYTSVKLQEHAMCLARYSMYVHKISCNCFITLQKQGFRDVCTKKMNHKAKAT